MSCINRTGRTEGLAQNNIKYIKGRLDMKLPCKYIGWSIFLLMLLLGYAPGIYADALFTGRKILLNNDKNISFRIGITGTTAGHNYMALIENAKEESISLGDLGYWELVSDPPSFLRNYDLQLIVKNNYKGNFQIEFNYNNQRHNIDYRIKEGLIEVKIDNSGYYPALIIDGVKSLVQMLGEGGAGGNLKNLLFFDFNSLDVDLRKYYGNIKSVMNKSDASHYFYYYESGGYNSYYFKTYKDVAELDTDKMGLSLEDGSLEYYQKILDNLKSLFGTGFADRVIIISRFGNKFSKELTKYAHEIGLGEDMDITFWSYDQIQ
jgi:hypothetical protein